MTLRHAAALALVGWYLMVPPEHPPSHAVTNWRLGDKLASWINLAAYDSAALCNKQKDEMIAETARAQKALSDQAEVLRVENDQCIATDDPRLKGK